MFFILQIKNKGIFLVKYLDINNPIIQNKHLSDLQ